MAFKHLTYAAIPLIAASMSVSLTAHGATVDQLNRQVQKLNQRIAAQDQRFRVNGFASFGMTMTDEEMLYNEVSDEINMTRFTKLGVQMTFNLDSQNSVVTQLVSRGKDDWDTSSEWAYFKHDFDNGFSSKIGRIRTPAFMLSEFLDVGYAVPWAQMPQETYDSLSPFANMDGADLSYSTDIGDMSALFTGSYGRSTGGGYDLKDILAMSASVQADTWNARVSYSESKVNYLDEGIQGAMAAFGQGVTDIDSNFISIGFTYDPGDLYLTTEFTTLEVDGALVDSDALYVTAGYRFGQWMPLLTYNTAESTDDDERSNATLASAPGGASVGLDVIPTAFAVAALDAAETDSTNPLYALANPMATFREGNNRNTTRIGLGLRYDMSPGVALKVQYDVIEVDGAGGMFDSTAYASTADKPDGVNMLTISIDTVF
jgi:hypothetical protein